MVYLKNKQHYIDLYDRHTIEQCRRIFDKKFDVDFVKQKAKEKSLDEAEAIRIMEVANKLHIYFITGDRYIKKEETIREWMEKDEAHDKFQEEAIAPKEITCLTCGRLMFVSSNHMDIGYDGKADRMLFFYDCPLEHIPRRAFYDNGEEFRREKLICPNCKNELTETDKNTKKKIITFINCSNCGYESKNEIEFGKKEKDEKPDPDYEKDRVRFCLSEKEGQDFIQAKIQMESMAKFMDKWKEKEKNKESYDKVAKLKKLKILELEELLAPILEKAGYIKLQFKNPEITRDVIVPFTVYEQRPNRENRASTYDLEKLLRKTLKETNWRLMTGGTSYRLGMLEGRLHGYEREEDLLRLIKDKEDKK